MIKVTRRPCRPCGVSTSLLPSAIKKKGRKTSNSQSPKRLKLETSFMHQPVSMIFRARLFETTTTFKKRGSTPSCFLQMSFLQLTFSETIVKYSPSIRHQWHQKLHPSSLTIPSRHPPKESRGQDRGPRVPHLRRLRRRFHHRHQGLGSGTRCGGGTRCARLTEAESHAEAKVRQLEKRLAHYENHESLHLARKWGEKTKEGMFFFGRRRGGRKWYV